VSTAVRLLVAAGESEPSAQLTLPLVGIGHFPTSKFSYESPLPFPPWAWALHAPTPAAGGGALLAPQPLVPACRHADGTGLPAPSPSFAELCDMTIGWQAKRHRVWVPALRSQLGCDARQR